MQHIPGLMAFDLDGTLVDSAPDIAASIDKTMRVMGLPLRGLEKVRHWMGNGVERLVKRALTNSMQDEPLRSDYIKALDLFLAYYGDNTAEHSRLYPGVYESLRSLAGQGIPLCCITNKRRSFSLAVLDAFDLHGFFSLVLAGDDLPRRKPDPLPLLQAAEFFQVSPATAVMVGDSVNDIAAARAAGFAAVAVSYGYNHGCDIRTAEPDLLIDSLAELGKIRGIGFTTETEQ